MKILLLGAAGFNGRAAAVLLARRDDVGELILVDYDIRDAKRLAKALSPKCRWAMADVGKPLELSRLLGGIDAVASAVGPSAEYEKAVLISCAAEGIPAVTIGEGTIAEEDRREIDGVFRDAGVPAVVGCGMMPGWTELLAAHFLDASDRSAHPPPAPAGGRYLFFSPARFGGYVFLRGVAKGITGAAPAPVGAPAGSYFALPDGSRIGVPEGKAGNRLRRIVGTVGKLGAVGKEFSAALLLWTRGGMSEPAGTPVAVAGVAAGDRFARVEDPRGILGAALLAETAVRLAARPHKATGLLPLPDLIGREEAEELAARS
ncbi:MAG TPA: saccharopine dehydrogenase NADP-binding domain-containing protein, partial [Candidatus Deferrimicrobium sp.]